MALDSGQGLLPEQLAHRVLPFTRRVVCYRTRYTRSSRLFTPNGALVFGGQPDRIDPRSITTSLTIDGQGSRTSTKPANISIGAQGKGTAAAPARPTNSRPFGVSLP